VKYAALKAAKAKYYSDHFAENNAKLLAKIAFETEARA
jgi:hypothetical protein